jgi:ribosomal protein S3AE
VTNLTGSVSYRKTENEIENTTKFVLPIVSIIVIKYKMAQYPNRHAVNPNF